MILPPPPPWHRGACPGAIGRPVSGGHRNQPFRKPGPGRTARQRTEQV